MLVSRPSTTTLALAEFLSKAKQKWFHSLGLKLRVLGVMVLAEAPSSKNQDLQRSKTRFTVSVSIIQLPP